MLPGRLLDHDLSADGRILPRWLFPRDDPWLSELVAESRAAAGAIAEEVDERLVERVSRVARRHGVGRRTVAAVWKIERRRWALRTNAPVSPREIRRVLFALSAERSREEALATAAVELGIDEACLPAMLFADRARKKLLVPPPSHATPAVLRDSYNLSVAESLLARSTHAVALLRTNLKRVVGYAKVLGLMTTFDEHVDGAIRMGVSGPMALLHETVKYGHAIARWLSVLVATSGWSLEASVLVAGETRRFALDASAPIPRTHALPRMHDSLVESRFETDLRKLGGSWRIERESGVIRAAAEGNLRPRLFFPDFSLVSERGRVHVEVVGFWTREYLEEKARMLRSARKPLVLCVDEQHIGSGIFEAPNVVWFRRRIDPRAVLAACERALGALGQSG
jgi:predicted nuclease of restriction endonuclease-like RecB superfamily